ncbi:hypothetical protein SNE25_02620 [Mucilaginibacter sabulilitoris]|uniref:NHL repeat-containing protein n=1 Tax=Mucilaginibacter sabulilitoris TaxID=1173583 RepID=A0ABZ0TRM0_9SPHI|nr:hypothetical protein [Mucilaginibacter sabulilitoris]WPU94414.1 hypothetical protein SNE25_02620 [Mucilaginibacter sabulilitoris]
MKTNSNPVLLLGVSIILFIAACKKNTEAPSTVSDIDKLGVMSATAAAKAHASLTVVTFAGHINSFGYADGTGSTAFFNYPAGIDLMDDGTLYVADSYNNKIRKITPGNVVSTIPIPNASDGASLVYPRSVRVSKDGSINIISDGRHNILILKPGGALSTPAVSLRQGEFSGVTSLEHDPYSDILWMSTNASFRKFLPDNAGNIGINPYYVPVDSLKYLPNPYTSYYIMALYCGYNGIKYLAMDGKHIYKYTPSGLFTEIYKDLKFNGITSIIASKDSRVLYIADQGAIKSIVNGKLQFLVGPNNKYPFGRDGVGSQAGVYAQSLALSKDESTIYFSDNSCIRKLYLR